MNVSLVQLTLCGFGKGCETFLVIDSHVGQDLPVQGDLSQLQAVHELAVGQTVHSGSRIDTGNPELTELALPLFSAGICACKGTHNGLLGDSVLFASGSSVTFGQL